MRNLIYLLLLISTPGFSSPAKGSSTHSQPPDFVTMVDGRRVIISDTPPPLSAFRTPEPAPRFDHLRLQRHPEGLRSHLMSLLPTPSSQDHSSVPLPHAAEMASVGNTLYAFSQQKTLIPELSDLKSRATQAEHESAQLREDNQKLRNQLEAGRSAAHKQETQRLSDLIAQNQRRLEIPVSEKLASASDRLIERKSQEIQARLADQLRAYDTTDLAHEIRNWNTYSREKKETLNELQELSTEAARWRDPPQPTDLTQDLFQSTIQAGLNFLTEAAQIAGGHRGGSFIDALQASQRAREIAKALLDVGLGLTPGIGFGKDCYEAFTGKSLIDGTKLDLFNRSFAVVGVATIGGSNIAQGAYKAIRGISSTLHARNWGHGLESAIRASEHGVTHLTRHTPIHNGPLHGITIPNPTGGILTVSDTFRSGTYITYTTTEPLVLYRVTSATPETAAVMKNLDTTTAHFSGYWTRTPPTSPTQAMIDSALERSWGSHANVWVKIEIPAGTTLHEGFTASLQRIAPTERTFAQQTLREARPGTQMSEFIGGGNQVFYNGTIEKEWIQELGDFL